MHVYSIAPTTERALTPITQPTCLQIIAQKVAKFFPCCCPSQEDSPPRLSRHNAIPNMSEYDISVLAGSKTPECARRPGTPDWKTLANALRYPR